MELHPSLRDNVRLLGEQLGQIMVTDRGGAFLSASSGCVVYPNLFTRVKRPLVIC